MSKEQIEEMAKIFCGMKNGCDGCMWDKVHCNERNYAEEIYNAGYRKQGEWISVDERLPESDARVLVYMHENRMSYTRIDTDRVVQGKWVRWESCVTHWMPLPEPPMMKGGAE